MGLKPFLWAIGGAFMLTTSWPANAISGAIKSDRLNECAIYLCLPDGFSTGCEAAKAAFISRITDFTAGGHRRYTDLPYFHLCTDPNPPGIEDAPPEVVGPPSTVDYTSGYEVHMPAINTCTRWNSRQVGGGQTVRYCAAISTTPAKVFDSTEAKHPYKTINVGDRNYTSGIAPAYHYTEVLVDNIVVGQRYLS